MDENDSTAESIESPPSLSNRDTISAPDPAVRFKGLGTNFRAKLIGIDDVPDSRGDQMCQESILKLKAAVQASGRHKQKVVINVSLGGIKIVDVLSGEVQHVHPVHRISFIARDLTDRRAFGYVYGAGEGRHQFFGIKTAKLAEVLVLALRDLFQVVYDMKKKEIEEAKTGQTTNGNDGEIVEPRQITITMTSQKQPVEQPTPLNQQRQGEGNLFDLEQQLSTIQEGINNIDAIGPWPQDMPTSPGPPGGDPSGDLFGIANLSDISSLSSDFSCASNIILDYGQVGGGHNQFERSGSARSSVSCQGIDHQQNQGFVRSSSCYSNKNHMLLSVPDDSSPIRPSPQVTNEINVKGVKGFPTPTKDSPSEFFTVNTVTKDESKCNGNEIAAEKDRGVSEPLSSKLKGSSSVGSLPGSVKVSKKHSSSFFSRSSKKSTKKLKVKKEMSMDKKKYLNTSPNNLNSENTSSNKRMEIAVTVVEASSASNLARGGSMSSVNSVRSCIVPSTTYSMDESEKSASHSSLDDVSYKLYDTQRGRSKTDPKSVTTYSSPTESSFVQSSICPRRRPKAKDSVRVASKDSRNPPMFKKHDTRQNVSDSDNTNVLERDSSESESVIAVEHRVLSTSPLSWNTSFDSNFEYFESSKKYKSSGKEAIDPFTGLATEELKISSSTLATFDDNSWNNFDDGVKVDTTSAADSYEKSLSPELCVGDFSSDPFSSVDIASLFDGVDPFADSLKSENPFHMFEKTSPEIQSYDEKPDLNDGFSGIQTFSAESDAFSRFDIVQTISADDSPFTSGMSTPLETHSPVHGSVLSVLSPLTSLFPPTIPPRLPPRPPKKNSSVADRSTFSDCPNIPPPPLPERCPTPSFEDINDEVDTDTLSPEYIQQGSGLEKKLPVYPPAIPQRIVLNSVGPKTLREEYVPDSSIFQDERLQSNSSNVIPKQLSYSVELFDLASPVAQPAPQPGARLTREQILSSYGGGGGPQQGTFPGQPAMMIPPAQAQMAFNPGYQQQMHGVPRTAPAMGMQGVPQAVPVMGMFASGPSPMIPPRPGAMRPNVPQPLGGGAPQNPFGDSGPSGAASMLSPMTSTNVQEPAGNAGKADPFANLDTGIGGTGETTKEDMFKNFQMAKPPQPPPRTNPPVITSNEPPPNNPVPGSNFDNYLLNSVGGVPISEDVANNNPTTAPGKQVGDSDPFGMQSGSVNQPAGTDPFGSPQAFSQPFEFNQVTNNSRSLFG